MSTLLMFKREWVSKYLNHAAARYLDDLVLLPKTGINIKSFTKIDKYVIFYSNGYNRHRKDKIWYPFFIKDYNDKPNIHLTDKKMIEFGLDILHNGVVILC